MDSISCSPLVAVCFPNQLWEVGCQMETPRTVPGKWLEQNCRIVYCSSQMPKGVWCSTNKFKSCTCFFLDILLVIARGLKQLISQGSSWWILIIPSRQISTLQSPKKSPTSQGIISARTFTSTKTPGTESIGPRIWGGEEKIGGPPNFMQRE